MNPNRESSADQQGPLIAKNAQEKINQVAQNFGGLWRLIFFVGAVAVTTAGATAIFSSIGSLLSPFSMMNQVFLLGFGLIMLVIDFPVQTLAIQDAKQSIFRYLLFMTRFTGRGFWYLYLATMIWGSLYNLDVEPFLGFFLSVGVAALGGVSIMIGIQKSLKLESVRKQICSRGLDEVNQMFAGDAMTLEDFNLTILRRYAPDTTFSDEDLQYVANALSTSAKFDTLISKDEFQRWTQGSMTIM